MALPSEPFSVPDPLANQWDEMVRRNRVLQAGNYPLATLASDTPPPLAWDDGPPLVGASGDDSIGGGAGQDILSARGGGDPRTAAPSAGPIDPARTDVFQRGADGKLHPIPGWHTTGPFDFSTWAHNIDWGGVLRDLNAIAARSIVGAGAPGLYSRRSVVGVTGDGLTPADKMTLGAGLEATGAATLDDLDPKRRAAGRK